MMISDAAFFLIFPKLQIHCQKLILRSKNKSTILADILNRREASQCAFLKLLNLPAGTSMKVIMIFILHKFSQETKLTDIVLFCFNPLKLKSFLLFLIDM